MASWEDELAMILRELGVTQEEPKARLQSTRKRTRSDAKHHQQSSDALTWNDLAGEDETWLTDLSAMRREVDSIVRQVIHLMQRGDLDKTLKEDILVVMRALRRRSIVSTQTSSNDEAYLEYAAAMLHFCRVILRLSESAIEDA